MGAEYVYDQKSEGKVRVRRLLMALFYVVFTAGFFVLCLKINIFLFAIGPLLTYILYLCTWRLVKYDCYWEFAQGTLTVGKVRATKNGRIRTPRVSVHVKEAIEAGYFESAAQLGDVKKIYDYSESPSSDKRVYVIYSENGIRSAVIVEATARLCSLLTSCCPTANALKGKPVHG